MSQHPTQIRTVGRVIRTLKKQCFRLQHLDIIHPATGALAAGSACQITSYGVGRGHESHRCGIHTNGLTCDNSTRQIQVPMLPGDLV